MKTPSFLTLSGLATLVMAPSLMADEPLLEAQAVEVEPAPEIAICGVVRMPATMSELKEMEANDEAIQSILNNEEAKTTIDKLNAPIVLNSMEDALKHLTRASMEKIAEVVDFEKQQVMIFAWEGSGQDRLSGHVTTGKDATANFHYNPGRTRDLKTHSAIYALPKGVEINVLTVEHRIIRCGVPDGGLEMKIEPMRLERGEELKLELKVAPAPKDK